MMLFGNPNVFALAMIPDAACPPFGFDVCMWANNSRIGNSRPWLGTYVGEIEGYLESFRRRDFATLSQHLLPLQDGDLLDALIRAVSTDWTIGPDSVERYLLFNLDDALDGWIVFVTEQNDHCRIWWSYRDVVLPAEFSRVSMHRDVFINSLSAFVSAARKVMDGRYP